MATISENAGSKVGWLENSNRSLRNTVLFKITANGTAMFRLVLRVLNYQNMTNYERN